MKVDAKRKDCAMDMVYLVRKVGIDGTVHTECYRTEKAAIDAKNAVTEFFSELYQAAFVVPLVMWNS